MKTRPLALRRHADFIASHDDPDTVTALRWAADDIESKDAEIARLRADVARLDAEKTADEIALSRIDNARTRTHAALSAEIMNLIADNELLEMKGTENARLRADNDALLNALEKVEQMLDRDDRYCEGTTHRTVKAAIARATEEK